MVSDKNGPHSCWILPPTSNCAESPVLETCIRPIHRNIQSQQARVWQDVHANEACQNDWLNGYLPYQTYGIK